MNLNNDYFLAKPKSEKHASDIEIDFFNAQLEAHLLFATWVKTGIQAIAKFTAIAVKKMVFSTPTQLVKRYS